jgi:hypothetical protein
MGVKNILRIQSTGELCVDEGSDIRITSGTSQMSIHVRVVDPKTYDLTDVTRDVNRNELVTYLVWNGSEYVFP